MLRGGPRAPQRDPLLVRLGEQLGGQADRAHPLEPRDLAQQRLKPGRAGIRTQLCEQPRAATGRLARLVFGDELFQPLYGQPIEPCDRPAQNRSSASLRALPSSRPSRPGGSRRSSRQRPK